MSSIEIGLIALIFVIIFIVPRIGKKSEKQKLLDCLASQLDQPKYGKIYNHYMLKGVYKTRSVFFMHALGVGDRLSDNMWIRMTPLYVPKPLTGFKSLFSSVSLCNYCYLISEGLDHYVSIEKPWLKTELGFFYVDSGMTQDSSRDFLDSLVAACEQVERGAYEI